MKYSFMSFSCPDVILEKMLQIAKSYGYDGIELRISSGHKHSVEFETEISKRKEIKKQINESGITLCCIATSCKYADPKNTTQQVEDTKKAIDLASDLGCLRIRVFGGVIPKEITREQAIDILSNSLKSIVDYSLQHNVTICIETHDDWCNSEHIAEVIKKVNHPALAINWDIMHPVRQGGVTIDEAFKILKPWIKHVHFHDGLKSLESLKMLPVGKGEIDHRRAVELLQNNSYDGFLSGEWINWEPYDIHLPRELAAMKFYEKQQ